MLWTLQLSPWAIPPLIATLVVGREILYLRPRRREPASQALLLLVLSSGAWTVLHLLAVISPSIEVKVALERAQYVAMSAVPLAWVEFALTYAPRKTALRRRMVLLLYVISAVTAALAIHPDGFRLILEQEDLALTEAGLNGLVVRYGPWFWVQIIARFVAIIVASTLVTSWMLRRRDHRGRAWVMVLACLTALGPSAAHLASQTGAQWIDLSPTGFALASAIIGWGLLRHRLLDLGPVARTLVMVELRDPVVVIDAQGRIVDANRAAENDLGLLPYGDVPITLGTLWASSRGTDQKTGRVVLAARTGALPQGDDSAAPERAFDVTLTSLGKREGYGRTAFVLRDVTLRERAERELNEANAELRRLANTDGLTQLYNRRAFMEALARELDRGIRYERPLSLILLDLDHFKKVNDTHGHAAGDDVLRGTADALRSVCRGLDVPGRLGGEELAVLLPETDAEGAMILAERLRERIQDGVFESPAHATFAVTASLGVAAASSETRTPEALVQRADEALYKAKKSGRNRVVLAS